MINQILEYIDVQCESPYAKWLDSLKDVKGKALIISRVDRMELGNFGNSKAVGRGVMELKIQYGPGYRVYYAQEGKHIYLLLCGGDKRSQSKDIARAQQYWLEYKRGNA